VLYTPPVVNTARIIDREVANVWGTVAGLSRRSIWRTDPMAAVRADQPTLLIVDESIVSKRPGSNSYATSTIADRWAWCLLVCRVCRSGWPVTHSCTRASASFTSFDP
jgi:hypothetical protein